MDKESIIELEKIDCNCNNCKFLSRDGERFEKSLQDHHRWQLNYFNTVKENLLKKADWWQNKKNPKYNYDKGENVRKEALKMKFQFDRKEASINYGKCSKFDKDVSFLPNTLQYETQTCFEHRRA
jgi:hypothetical protein